MKSTPVSDGSVRENHKPHYRLIPFPALRRIALAFSEGKKKYFDEIGSCNWKRAKNKEFAYDCFDHAIEHLYAWADGDRSEDHLGHAAANICFMIWFEIRGLAVPPTDDEAYGPAPLHK